MATCKACGGDVGDSENGIPCPHCGQTLVREFTLKAEPGHYVLVGQDVGLTVVRHFAKLLSAADRLYAAGEYGVAVIVAAMACEVVVNRAMAKAFEEKGVGDLAKPVMDLMFTRSLHGDKNRKLYTALTGDEIATQSFWQSYRRLVERRNETVHSGHDVPAADACQGVDAARLFVEHVERVNGLE